MNGPDEEEPPDEDATDPGEVGSTSPRGPQFRIGSLMVAVAAAALIFKIAVGPGGIVGALALFIMARLVVGWRAKYRRPGDVGLVILGVDEEEFGDAMVYASFALVFIVLTANWSGWP